MSLFNSHIKNLRIVVTPSRPIYEQGVRLGDTQGKYIQFENGRFQTDDKEIIEKVKKLPTFGIDFWMVEDKPESKEDEQKEPLESEFESQTRQELLQIAKDKGLEVDSKATKKELLELLKK